MKRLFAIDLWREIPGHAGYEVSFTGEIRSRSTGRRLKPWIHRSGHLYVGLGRRARIQVHHAVMLAFGPTRPEGSECRHLDGNASRNCRSNLQWGSRQENVDDLKRTSGRYAKAQLFDDAASEILRRSTGRRGEQTEFAREFGLSISLINRLVNRRTYAHLRG